ncbi:F-box protein At4g00755-like isoform X2 [Primulina tabacum]
MDLEKVEIKIDFLQCLETDMSLHIMSFLDDPVDIVRASATSHFWRQFVVTNGLAKKLCLKYFPQLANIVGIIKESGESIDSVEEEMNDAMEWKILERDHQAYASLHQALTKSNVSPKDCISNAISASSTDNYPDESVVNTLNPRDRFIRRASYWSSKGQSNPAVPESLIYKLRDGIWVITEIDIQPFEAFFQAGKPIYSAKFVRFRIGYSKNPNEIERDASHKYADDKFLWSYTSPRFPMMQENSLQPFKLPEPVLCIGGYLQIELLGRVQTQEMDGLFYICICYVRVLGRPLFPAFDIELVEPDRKFLLKHYPENLSSVLQASPSDEIPNMRRFEEEMLWERIGLLENLLRGIQQGPNNPFHWEEDEDDINGLIL